MSDQAVIAKLTDKMKYAILSMVPGQGISTAELGEACSTGKGTAAMLQVMRKHELVQVVINKGAAKTSPNARRWFLTEDGAKVRKHLLYKLKN